MKRLLSLLLLCIPLAAFAGVPEGTSRHQVRIGWGDMLFESLVFHPGTSLSEVQKTDFAFTGHIFGEYQYRLSKAISLGAQVDFEGIFWKEDGAPVNNYNLIAMPTLRVIYLERPWFSLYSSVGFGAILAFDNAGGKEFAPAGNLNLISFQVGKGHWSGTFGIGALNAIKNANRVYMVGSRLFSISLNYSW